MIKTSFFYIILFILNAYLTESAQTSQSKEILKSRGIISQTKNSLNSLENVKIRDLHTKTNTQAPSPSMETTSIFIFTSQLWTKISQIISSYISDYATMDTTFERVIGLGKCCYTKSSINQYFQPQEKNVFKTKPGHSDLLDWLIIEPEPLTKAINNNFQDFFDIDDFILEPKIQCVFNKKYDTTWMHLFPGVDRYKTNVLELFKRDYKKIREKIDYLTSKFNQTKKYKTLYIYTRKECPDKTSMKKLRDAIKNNRDQNKNFILLVITNQRKFDDFDNVIVKDGFEMKAAWDGGKDEDKWKETLDQFKFTPNIWN